MTHYIEINHLDHEDLQIYTGMSENQIKHFYEPHGGLFIAESVNVIERALEAGCKPVSMLVDTARIEGEAARILDKLQDTEQYGDVPVYCADEAVLKEMTGFGVFRGALSAMIRPALPSVEDICAGKTRIAVLEDVMNPTNVGAIFRSAAALGMEAVLLTGGCSDPLYRRSIRVSMGTVFQIPWTYVENLPEGKNTDEISDAQAADGNKSGYVHALHNLGFDTAAMALRKDTIDITDPILQETEKLAVILGTEGEGLRETTIDATTHTIKIPMSHGVDSLNVAAASAVAFWTLGKLGRT